MFTLPLINLFVGMHVIAPRYNVDPVLCGGFLSVATVLAISIGYIIYGLLERAPSDVAAASGKEVLQSAATKKAQ
ncbi:hypothetical protein STCU_11653 [Strigomonas culicis]|uniref:Uncharacterized protein n=1 Tax=Strigomonas culicis TaxID=28005 RepID=S9TG84_9TRYP|nr:hypothetical protein STCU_11653 [Strigomonas culicis]|eukprot:EPY15949.1 hypothetical protein STCU_11653 [Strigomonas culicis]